MTITARQLLPLALLALCACDIERVECAAAADCTAKYPCQVNMVCQADGRCAGGETKPAACGARTCGLDACGNSCGSCADGTSCAHDGQCRRVLRPIKAFTCTPESDAPSATLSKVVGGSGEHLDTRATDKPCQRKLVYVDGNGGEVELSREPSGYATAVGRKFASGHVLVCASNIAHHLHEKAAADSSLPRVHAIDKVSLECAAFDGSSWSKLGPMVVPDGEWAAWARGNTEEVAADPPTFAIRYARDFTFQFLNLTNHGRPETDGTYRLGAHLAGGELLADGSPLQESPNVVFNAWAKAGQWTPTEEEKKKYAGQIDFDEGPCPPPNGCPQQ